MKTRKKSRNSYTRSRNCEKVSSHNHPNFSTTPPPPRQSRRRRPLCRQRSSSGPPSESCRHAALLPALQAHTLHLLAPRDLRRHVQHGPRRRHLASSCGRPLRRAQEPPRLARRAKVRTWRAPRLVRHRAPRLVRQCHPHAGRSRQSLRRRKGPLRPAPSALHSPLARQQMRARTRRRVHGRKPHPRRRQRASSRPLAPSCISATLRLTRPSSSLGGSRGSSSMPPAGARRRRLPSYALSRRWTVSLTSHRATRRPPRSCWPSKLAAWTPSKPSSELEPTPICAMHRGGRR